MLTIFPIVGENNSVQSNRKSRQVRNKTNKVNLTDSKPELFKLRNDTALKAGQGDV